MTIAHDVPRTAAAHNDPADPSWNQRVYDVLKGHRVTQVSYVPDAGHTETINRFLADEDVATTVLTTEEEGIALSTGAWLGGERSVVLMQSSGVGNCINMLSLPVITRSPFLTLVTMRGEWHEFNPWQMPMGHAVEASLAAVGVHVMRATTPEEVPAVVDSAATMAFQADQQIAVLISQQVMEVKSW